MRLTITTTRPDADYLEPAPSLLLPLCCLLAITVAIAVVAAELGPRLALIAGGFAAVSLATRLPRVLAATAVLCLVLAGTTVLAGPGSAATVAGHVVTHAKTGQ